VHAIEAFIARVTTPVARGLALEAVRHVGQSLQRAVEFPSDREARDGMAIGSHLAGMAFANSSCCAVHALALPLGGRYPIPHGVITGCFVGEVMRHNATNCEKDISTLCSALGWKLPSIDLFAHRLDALAESIGLRDALKKFTITENSIMDMANDAIKNRRLMDPNPREVNVDDAVRIYQSVLSGTP
jgi:alcohol dehydrogenase class IV